MLTRREFHKRLTGAALAAMAGGPRIALAATNPIARQHLNRLTFGATPELVAELDGAGLAAWLDAQLSMPATDPELEDRLQAAVLEIEYEEGIAENGASWPALKEHRPFQYQRADPADLLKFLDFDQPFAWPERVRPADEVIAASLIRATHAKAQLREVMAQFWHEHFSVNAHKDETTAIFFPQYDRVMRHHALGNFRALLGDVARAPGMLFYLNNEASRASPANENYARELLELHTLGAEHYYNDLYDNWRAVPGAVEGMASGYIDQDVYEVARAFTGWSVGDGRWLSDGVNAPMTGRFEYVEAWHDPYQKRILGREFAPNRGPTQDGEDVLDLLAAHPGTARFIGRKIIRRLGLEQPSDALVRRVADVFHSSHADEDQIAKVIRAIVLDPEFAQTPPQKLRRPFEFLVALYRATGAEIAAKDMQFNWYLGRGGWTQHDVHAPTGHSDLSADWANTRCLNATVDLALYAHDDWFTVAAFDAAATHGAKTWGELAAYWAVRFGPDPAALADGLAYVDGTPDEALPDDSGHVAWANRTLISLAALTPAHLFR
ncbi:MAG: DUF1800 domain-containing protein [Paracoccaceae bacterium]